MRQAEFIAQEARDAGAEVSFQDFRQQTVKGLINFRNIVAEVKGADKRFLIISAHCDLKDLDIPEFEGANDGASGTAVQLEMLRALQRSKAVPPVSLRFVFFDGEECMVAYSDHDGLFGSRHYAGAMTKEERKLCLGVINIDMVGDRDLLLTLPVNSDEGLAKLALRAAESSGNSIYMARSEQTILDDHVPFAGKGIPALTLIDFSYGPANSYWHTGADRMDKISAKSLEITGNVVFSMIWGIKN